MFLCRVCLLQCIIDYEVQKQVVSAQRPTNFAAPLEMDKEFLVHELCRRMLAATRVHTKDMCRRTFLSSGWEALDMVA